MSYSNQRYQGYPYVKPIVTDVPTVDPASASRWANLPRRAISTAVPRPGPSGTSKNNGAVSSSSRPPAPVSPTDDDDDDNPVVYIDMSDLNGSNVSTTIETPSEEPEFVQDTFLYDPFENTRIDVPKDDSSSVSTDTRSEGPSTPSTNPRRPNTLDTGRGNSSIQSPTSAVAGLPQFLQKEAYVYGGHGSDGFPLSPIPVSDFPEPPPAYTELDITTNTPSPAPPVQEPQRPPQPQRPPEPPRTQVIITTPDPGSPVGVMSYNRKFLTCQHCGSRVHTVVIKENGYMTYFLAVFFFIFMMPAILLLVCTDFCKHKNHYCPTCNRLIGYQMPLIGQEIHLVAE